MITLVSAVQTMITQSAMAGFAALAATFLAFVAVCTPISSYLPRTEKGYRTFDLVIIGAVSAMLVLGGFALAYWSKFQINMGFGVVSGFGWASHHNGRGRVSYAQK
jgi:hypothetical protein